MRVNRSTGHSSDNCGALQKAESTFLERRRRYNREYMRSWRADPRHRTHERDNRKRWHYQRKVRALRSSYGPSASDRGQPVCGLCRKNPSLTEIVRLRISENAPHDYVEMRIPYCGQC